VVDFRGMRGGKSVVSRFLAHNRRFLHIAVSSYLSLGPMLTSASSHMPRFSLLGSHDSLTISCCRSFAHTSQQEAINLDSNPTFSFWLPYYFVRLLSQLIPSNSSPDIRSLQSQVFRISSYVRHTIPHPLSALKARLCFANIAPTWIWIK